MEKLDFMKKYVEMKAKYYRFDAEDKPEEEEEEAKPKKSSGNWGGGGGHSSTSLPYGIAKGAGLDTTGMTPHEVWKMLEGKGYSASAAFAALKSGKKGAAVGEAAKGEAKGTVKKEKAPSKPKAPKKAEKPETAAVEDKPKKLENMVEEQPKAPEAITEKPSKNPNSNKPYTISSDFLSKKDVHFMEPGTKIKFGDDEITKGGPVDGKSMWTVKHPDGSMEEWTGGKLQHMLEKTPKDIEISLPEDSKKGKHNLDKHFPGKSIKEKMMKEHPNIEEKEDGTLHTPNVYGIPAATWDSMPEGTSFEWSGPFGKVALTKDSNNKWGNNNTSITFTGAQLENSFTAGGACDIKIPDKAVKNTESGETAKNASSNVKSAADIAAEKAAKAAKEAEEKAAKAKADKEAYKEAEKNSESKFNSTLGKTLDQVKALFKSAKKYKSMEEADADLRADCGKVWKTLTGAQKDALYKYTGPYYKGMNMACVNWFKNKIHADPSVKAEVEAITGAINKCQLPQDTMLYRGTGKDTFCNMFGLSGFSKLDPKDLIGLTGTNDGFSSCGTIANKAWGKAVTLEIMCPKGTKAIYTPPWSAHGGGDHKSWNGESGQVYFGEGETLLQRGTNFQIVGAKWSDSDHSNMKVQVVVLGQDPKKLG